MHSVTDRGDGTALLLAGRPSVSSYITTGEVASRLLLLQPPVLRITTATTAAQLAAPSHSAPDIAFVSVFELAYSTWRLNLTSLVANPIIVTGVYQSATATVSPNVPFNIAASVYQAFAAIDSTKFT